MRRYLNPEIVLGFFIATIFWAIILGWQAAYAPTEIQRNECYEAAKKAGHKTEECKSLWEKTTSDPVALFTLVLAVSTVGLWWATIALYRAGDKQMQLIERNAERHSEDMKASVAEANRAAAAMEDVAKAVAASAKAAAESVETVRNRTAMQMRAYLSVGFGAIVPQTRETGYRFEVRVILTNTGHTPAHRVTNRVIASVLPHPLPDGFVLQFSDGPPGSAGVLNAGQNFVLSGILGRLLSDEEINEVENSRGKAIYVYGVINYDDVFGEHRQTRFCHSVTWFKNGTHMLYNAKQHNDAT